jgi:lipopolysaccharide export system protein LptC
MRADSALRRPVPLALRLRDGFATWLPLLLMGLLALATWWLVRNAPQPPGESPARAVSAEPDYTMSGFALERFGADGQLVLRIAGEQLRHYPADDRIEIDGARIEAWSPEGRLTRAQARHAVGKGDGSELELQGGAEVVGSDGAGVPLTVQSEFLRVYLREERLFSDRPVRVRHGSTDLAAAGVQYAHATQRLDLKGPLRVQLTPRAAAAR